MNIMLCKPKKDVGENLTHAGKKGMVWVFCRLFEKTGKKIEKGLAFSLKI